MRARRRRQIVGAADAANLLIGAPPPLIICRSAADAISAAYLFSCNFRSTTNNTKFFRVPLKFFVSANADYFGPPARRQHNNVGARLCAWASL